MPNSDTIELHVDAARGQQCSGLGYVICGEVSLEGRRVLMGTHSSMEAEYYALVEGLRVASIESESRMMCEAYTDCKPLTTKMRVPDANSQDWYDRRQGCHWLLNKFDKWELEHISRRTNSRAHELAREALFEGRSRDA